MSEVTFITRRGCTLCSAAFPLVEAAAMRRGHCLEVVDVDDAGLASRYGDRVPVVLRDGVEVAWGRIRRRTVARALR